MANHPSPGHTRTAAEARREHRLELLAKCLYFGAAIGIGLALVGGFVYLACYAYFSERMSPGACIAHAGLLSIVFSRITVVTGGVAGALAGLVAYEIRRILRHEPGLTGRP